MPALQTSAYLEKKVSIASASTMVEMFILPSLLFVSLFVLPLVARRMIGTVVERCRSGNDPPLVEGFSGSDPYDTERCQLKWVH